MRVVLDIETNLAWNRIWLVGLYTETGESIACDSAE